MFVFCLSDKTWVFDQSERTQGAIYVVNHHNIAFRRKQCPVFSRVLVQIVAL